MWVVGDQKDADENAQNGLSSVIPQGLKPLSLQLLDAGDESPAYRGTSVSTACKAELDFLAFAV